MTLSTGAVSVARSFGLSGRGGLATARLRVEDACDSIEPLAEKLFEGTIRRAASQRKDLLQGRLHMDVKAGGGERAVAKHAAGSSDASNCDLLD